MRYQCNKCRKIFENPRFISKCANCYEEMCINQIICKFEDHENIDAFVGLPGSKERFPIRVCKKCFLREGMQKEYEFGGDIYTLEIEEG